MNMDEWIEALKAINENRSMLLGAQLHIHGQINAIIDALGGTNAAYEYFVKVRQAEPPIYPMETEVEERP